PFREIDRYNTAPTDMLWHSSGLLWTVGNEGMFTQTDIQYAPKTIDRRSLSTFDFSPSGKIWFHTQGRPRRRALDIEHRSGDIMLSQNDSNTESKSPSGEKFSISRSDSESDTAGSFLGRKSSPKRQQDRRSLEKSIRSLGNTPPSAGS